MDKQLRIILTYVDEASAGIAATVKAVGGMQSAFGAATTAASKTTSLLASAWEKTGGRVIGAIKGIMFNANALSSLFIGGAITAGIEQLINLGAQFERFSIAAEFLTGSRKAADEFAASIRKVAIETMFNVDQIADLETRLIGNTKNVKQSEGALVALADAVAATGGAFPELEGATRAWIQTNAKAIASSEEMNRQFANANIPIVRLVAEHIVNDLNSPLRKYISIAGEGGATGATKTLTKAYTTASANLGVLGDKLKLAQLRQEEYSKSSKKTESGVLSHSIAVQQAQKAYDKATETINDYNAAQKNITKSAGPAKLSVESVMAQLQSLGDLKIPGSIMAAEITKALNEAYGGANKKLINTFTGQVSMLRDVLVLTATSIIGLDQNFRPIKGGLLDTLEGGLKPFVKFLQDHQQDIANFFSKLSNGLPIVIALAAAIVGMLAKAILMMFAPVIAAGLAWGALGYLLGIIITKLGLLNLDFQAIGVTIQTIVVKAIDFINSKLESFSTKIKEAMDIMMGVLIPALGTIKTLFINVFQAIEPILSNVMSKLGPAFQQLGQSLMALGQALIPLIPGLVMLVGIILTVAAAILTGFVTALAAAIPYVVQFVTGVIDLITGMVNLVRGLFQGNNELVLQALGQLRDGAINIFVGLVGAIVGIVGGFVNGIIGFFQGLYETLVGKSIIPDMVNAIIQWFSTLKDRALGLVTDLANGIRDKFSGLARDAWGWGKGIISNMINGIKSAIAGAGKLAGALAGKLGMSVEEIMHFQHGGIVPGPVGATVPIIAHGGERITPRGSNTESPFAGSANITINMTGPVNMDSPQRVKDLANEIKKILGRESELAHYGLGVNFV